MIYIKNVWYNFIFSVYQISGCIKTKLGLSSFWWKTICQNKKCHFYYDSDNNKKRSDVFMDDNECSFCPVFMVQDVSGVSSFCTKTESQLLNIICVKMCRESKGVRKRRRLLSNVDHKWSYCVCASYSRTQNTKRNEHAWKRLKIMEQTMFFSSDL